MAKMGVGGKPGLGHVTRIVDQKRQFVKSMKHRVGIEKLGIPNGPLSPWQSAYLLTPRESFPTTRKTPMPSTAQYEDLGLTCRGNTISGIRDGEQLRITAWPLPQAVVRTSPSSSEWRPFVPEFRIVHQLPLQKKPVAEKNGQLHFPFFADTKGQGRPHAIGPKARERQAWELFRQTMPSVVAQAIEPFATHQWPLLLLLAHDPAALDLAKQNPVLAYIVAQQLEGDVDRIRELRCGTWRRRDLLPLLGLPASPRLIGLFEKVVPSIIHGDNWQDLIEVWKRELTDETLYLNHLSCINAGVLAILTDPAARELVSPPLLHDVANDRREELRAETVYRITATREQMTLLGQKIPPGSLERTFQLDALHDRSTVQYEQRVNQLLHAHHLETREFLCIPLPGIPGKIEPITSARGLIDEGEAQGNCVATYADQVRAGDTYIYRVLHPERATLALTRTSPLAPWRIGQLEGKFNSDVDPETEAFVEAWVSRHRC